MHSYVTYFGHFFLSIFGKPSFLANIKIVLETTCMQSSSPTWKQWLVSWLSSKPIMVITAVVQAMVCAGAGVAFSAVLC